MIDYTHMQKSGPKLKAMLTRANNKPDAKERYAAVKDTCRAAVKEWDAIGAWPDNWALWQRTLKDAAYAYMRTGGEVDHRLYRLEEL